MTVNQATNLVLRVLGIAECPKESRKQLYALLELLMQSKEPVYAKKTTTLKEEVNNLPPEENSINLADAYHFDFPKEFNLQVEGEEGQRKIKIFPDGISETEPKSEEEHGGAQT